MDGVARAGEGRVMDFLKILRSVEELLYEVISWLVFYPKTLWMTATGPLRTMAYSDREQQDKPEQQYLETLSPPLFLVLSILIAWGIERAAHLSLPPSHTDLGRLVQASSQNLLIFRALAYSLFPLLFATAGLKIAGRQLNRESLRAPFFAQCYLGGAMAIGTGLGTTAIRFPGEVLTFVGLGLILIVWGWYLTVQWRWLRRIEGVGPVRAAVWAVGVMVAADLLVIAAGVATA